jgi:hypothetical protein
MAAARIFPAGVLLLLASCCGTGRSYVQHQYLPHGSAPAVRLPVSPLKSCEPLRGVPAEQLALLRGHFQRYQALARRIREMENYQRERPQLRCR